MEEGQTLRIVHYYAKYLAHPSGVTESISNWAALSSESGYETSILCAPPPNDGDGEMPRGAGGPEVKTIKHLGRRRETYIPFAVWRHLNRGDLVVLHEGWVLANVVVALTARLRGAHLVVVPHGVYEAGIVDATRDVMQVRRQCERLVLRLAEWIHVFYEGEKGVVQAFLGGAQARFVVLPNGAPDIAEDALWRGDGDYFVWIGRFDILAKGLDHVIEFWRRLSTPRPRLVLAGPDYKGGRREVERLVSDAGLSDVVVVRKAVKGAEKRRLMSGARGYLHPSRWESCSIAMLESIGAGTPSLISSSIHAAQELVPLGVVHAVDFQDPSVDANVVLGDLDRNEKLQATALEWHADRGSWASVGKRYVQWLRSVESGRGRDA